MVRARLARLKWQTRRMAEPQPFPDLNGHGWHWRSKALLAAGYGAPYIHAELGEAFYRAMEAASKFKVGDRIWWREAWKTLKVHDHAPGSELDGAPVCYLADDLQDVQLWGRYRHARFMPRWAARLVDEISEVRVQRLQDISEEDAHAEGIEPLHVSGTGRQAWRMYPHTDGVPGEEVAAYYGRPFTFDPIESYRSLWLSINGPGSWDTNPFVVALTFKETTP